MKIGITYTFLLNTTKHEWHELQHTVDKWITDETLHCLSKKFDSHEGECTFTEEVDDQIIDFYIRLNTEKLCIEIIALGR